MKKSEFTEKEYESTDLSLGALSADIVDRQLQTKNNLNDLIQLGIDMQGEKENTGDGTQEQGKGKGGKNQGLPDGVKVLNLGGRGECAKRCLQYVFKWVHNVILPIAQHQVWYSDFCHVPLKN